MKITFFQEAAELRAWLDENHEQARELWVGFYKTHAEKAGATYAEALDEALCFGWIDGVRKSMDEFRYTIRFSPRRAKSIWSRVNLKRAGELVKLGRMAPAGLQAFHGRDKKRAKLYAYENRERELPRDYERKFRANVNAWEFFRAQAPSYQRTAIYWALSAKQEATRLRRLDALIKASENERRPGAFIPPASKVKKGSKR
ncbi:MAG: YdeI/OmpD-associated family protein [Candidatus Acidiferrales bacterium]